MTKTETTRLAMLRAELQEVIREDRDDARRYRVPPRDAQRARIKAEIAAEEERVRTGLPNLSTCTITVVSPHGCYRLTGTHPRATGFDEAMVNIRAVLEKREVPREFRAAERALASLAVFSLADKVDHLERMRALRLQARRMGWEGAESVAVLEGLPALRVRLENGAANLADAIFLEPMGFSTLRHYLIVDGSCSPEEHLARIAMAVAWRQLDSHSLGAVE